MLSASTIRRAIRKGYLKCSGKSGKLIFKKSNVDKWPEDKNEEII